MTTTTALEFTVTDAIGTAHCRLCGQWITGLVVEGMTVNHALSTLHNHPCVSGWGITFTDRPVIANELPTPDLVDQYVAVKAGQMKVDAARHLFHGAVVTVLRQRGVLR